MTGVLDKQTNSLKLGFAAFRARTVDPNWTSLKVAVVETRFVMLARIPIPALMHGPHSRHGSHPQVRGKLYEPLIHGSHSRLPFTAPIHSRYGSHSQVRGKLYELLGNCIPPEMVMQYLLQAAEI